MAIFITGKTICSLCGEIIQAGQAVVAFPPFVSNGADPLSEFNDKSFHARCFELHPLSQKADSRYVELREMTSVERRKCTICGERIDNPDDYMSLGHLTDDSTESVHVLNYAQFHRHCIGGWKDFESVYNQLNRFMNSDKWKGPAIGQILSDMKKLSDTPS